MYHVKVKGFTQVTSLKPRDVIFQNPQKMRCVPTVKYTSLNHPLCSNDSWDVIKEMTLLQHSILLEVAWEMTTVDLAGEGSASNAVRSPTCKQKRKK